VPVEEPKAPIEEPKLPVEEPKEADPFGGPAKEEAPAEEPKEADPFGGPAKEEAPAEEPADPFGGPVKKEDPAEPAPAVKDPFGMKIFEKSADEKFVVIEPAVVNPMTLPGGLNSTQLRTWTDNSGTFSVEGRLVKIMEEKVQLFKANGRYTTFPLHRLSALDHQFVQQQALALNATVPPTSTVAK